MSLISAKIIGDGISYKTYAAQAPGVGRGHKDFIMSRGEIKNFASNAKRYLDGYREEESDTTATVFGSLVECAAGLNGKFEDSYAVSPAEYKDEKTGAMKPWTFAANVCKAWREEQGDREIIKSELHEEAKLAVAALESDPDVSELFRCSRKQVMAVGVWLDKATGLEIPLRCLLDLVPASDTRFGKWLCDFKTARNGCPDTWPRVTDDYGYDIQAALSLDLYIKATGEDRVDWVHVVAENVHPYHVVKPFPALSTEFLAYGRAKYQSALERYAWSLDTGYWPSFPTGNRIVLGSIQIIGPESLYSYREFGGLPQMGYEPRAEPKKQFVSDPNDLIP